MSNAFAALARINDSGQIPVVIGSGALPADTNYFQGLPLNTNGEVLGSTASKVRVDNGIPYDADGRVCFKLEPTAYVNGSIPYAATGELAATNDSPSGASGGMPFANGGFSIGSGNTPPIPPLRPLSKLKYTFTQTNLEAAITDRVGGVNKLETFIGTDVNAVQTIDGGIRTFEFGENLLPASLLAQDGNPAWTGTGGQVTGSPIFTDDTGLGEISCSASGSNDRSYARSSFSAPSGDSVFSCKVIDCGLVPIQPRDLVSEVGVGSLLNYKINGSIVSESTPVLYQQGDILEAVYNFSSSSSTQFRIGLGTSTPNTADGMSIKLTQPMVNTGTERGPFVQPDGNPVTKYTQAFDVGVGALIEPSAVTQIPSDMTLWDDSGSSTSTYNATTKENRWTFENGASVAHRFFTNSSVTDGLDYIMSAEFKKGESQFVQIAGSTGFNLFAINYDLVNGLSNDVTSFARTKDFGIIDIGDSYIVYVVAESNSTTQGRMIFFKADSLNSARNPPTSDAGAFTVKYPNFVQSSALSSPISAPFGAAQRDASTPQVTSDGLTDSETVVYNEYINLQQLDEEVRAMWFYGSEVDNAAIGTICLETVEGAQVQLVRAISDGSILPVLPVIMEQGINVGDRLLVACYLKSDLFTLLVENKTTGESQYAQDAAIAGIIGGTGLAPIGLGDLGFIASTFIHKKIDFEVTEYTDPPLPDFIDNGDFDLTSGDFADG